MTTCTPLKPFRAWQYRKDSTEPVPEWARDYAPDRFSADGKQPDGMLDWWLVEEHEAQSRVRHDRQDPPDSRPTYRAGLLPGHSIRPRRANLFVNGERSPRSLRIL
jgi:hypothetical protein